MDENIYEYFILNKTMTFKSLSFTLVIIFASLVFVFYLFYAEYEKYYTVVGCYEDNKVSLYVEINKMKHILKNNYLIIDDNRFEYAVSSISEEIINDNNKNYQKVYINLDLDNKYRINNYLFEVKMLKEKKKIILYLYDMVKGGKI